MIGTAAAGCLKEKKPSPTEGKRYPQGGSPMLKGKMRVIASIVCIVIVLMMILGMVLPAFGA